MKNKRSYCDGVRRRDFLSVGSAGLFGMGLDLPGMLAGQAMAAAAGGKSAKDDVSVIIVFLKGGLSTIDTFDLKPDAPADIRGDFNSIATNVPGVRICEHLPRVAQVMDKFSLIRSFGHSNSGHGAADHYMLTGYLPGPGFNSGLKPNNQRPAHGSIISRKLGPRGSMTPYVCLPNMHPSGGSAYLGATAAPFVIEADPSAPNFSVPDLAPPLTLGAERLSVRHQLLSKVDRYSRSAEIAANKTAGTVNVFRQKALDLMTSPTAKRAFDLNAESDQMRERYGRHTLGQSCLMARRLVEAGVRCVTIDHSNWDTHDKNFVVLKQDLLPHLDSALSTLFSDLTDRGMLDKTMVIVTGEFGRTPRINKNAGRDHWGPGFTVALGGGGIQGGRVIGSSDKWAQKPAEDPHGPENLAATMYSLLGINHKEIFITADGRPAPIVSNGRIIRELL